VSPQPFRGRFSLGRLENRAIDTGALADQIAAQSAIRGNPEAPIAFR
jgi:hypothetical protein